MRKDKAWKQVLALVLSAALVVGNCSSVSAATGDPAADNGAGTAAEGTADSTRQVTDTDAYKELKFDFEDGVETVSGDDGLYTENGIKFVNRNGVELVDAPVVTDDDAERGKALKFTRTKEGVTNQGVKYTTGDSCLTSESGAFSELDFTNGFTLSMEIYPEAQRDWNYMFGLGVFGEKWVSGSIGFIAQYGEPWTNCFPADGWLPDNVVNSNWNYFGDEANVHKWYKLDYVYTLDGFTMKVNGNPVAFWGVERAKMQTILEEASNGQLRIGMGSALENEGFLGCIDNVSIQPKTPCEHELGDDAETEDPTCTTAGFIKGTCTKCNEMVIIEISALGHDFGEPVAAKEPTCTEKGNKEYYTCKREANSYFVSEDDGIKQVAKSKVEIDAKGHSYGAATVTTKATPDQDGVMTSVCSDCPAETTGHTKTEVINKVNNITLAGTSFAHTGKAITPAVTVKDSKGAVVAASNYTVSYTNNLNPGTATVTITFKGDKYAGSVRKTFTIAQAASLSLNKSAVTLYTGKASKTAAIKAAVTGANKTVTWKSSNDKIAKVDKNGKITAVKAGKATITATANGISKSVKVTVKNPTITIKNGKKAVKKNTVPVKRKKSVKLTVSVSPKNSGITVSKLTKKQAKIASVTYKKGKLTIKGKKKGTVKVKITSGKGTKTLTVKVK